MQPLIQVLRLSKPLFVLFSALTYMLGAGIARYLGISQDALPFWLGLGGVIFAQFSMSLLAEALRPVEQPSENDQHRPERVRLRNSALMTSLGALAAIAFIALILVREDISPAAMLFMGLSLFVVLAYAVPPLRLVDAGFGEFMLAVHIGVISTALGFLLQSASYHRLVTIVSFPLTLLALAYFIVLDFPTFSADQKYDRRTLLRNIGWERAVPLHNGLLLGSYVLIGGAFFFGLAWSLIWPSLLTFPFALFQIWQLRNISLGAKPVWNLLTVNAMAVFGLTTYFLTFAFWMR